MAHPETMDMPDKELSSSPESWWRMQSATIVLLNKANGLLDEAEERIAAQEKRIRQLEDLAATDPLTGLMNRRGFEKFFQQEQERLRRHQSPGSLLVLIDLDLFKHINDTKGHLAGDACLRAVAENLKSSIRLLDGAARLGGDEFALLLTQTDPAKATLRAEKIRHILDRMEIGWRGKKLRFGASCGSAVVTAQNGLETAYRSADQALYADKMRRRKK